MKSVKALALLAMTLAASAGLWAQELPLLGVVEFNTNSIALKTTQDAITIRNLVESEMVASGKFEVITRNDIDKLLAEQKIAVSAITSAENVKKLQLKNISYIVTGSVDAMGTDYAVTVKVLNVSTGKFSHSANNCLT
jgi:curli biogenesis system outer membrane secretion channel CsgG